MTIRAVGEKMAIPYPVEVPAPPTTNSALVFILNRRFLPGYKTLLYSLLKSGSFLDLPVLVYSEEPDVLQDYIVSTSADESRILTRNDISQFEKVAADLIPDRVRLDWIPKYTFLKWTIFDHSKFDQLIWIDCDVLCLGNVNDLVLLRKSDIYAGSVFQRSLFSDRKKNVLPLPIRQKRIVDFSLAKHPIDSSLNSGVMVVNKGALNPEFRAQLIREATENASPTEQKVVRTLLARRSPCARGWLCPLYNFHHTYVQYVGAAAKIGLLNRIKLLHYIGASANPWENPASKKITDRLWWEFNKEAQGYHGDFSV